MFELTKGMLVIDPDMEVSEDRATVTAYIETWFDVDEKFGTHTTDDDDTWGNLYGIYDVKTHSLTMKYVVDSPDGSIERDYTPTGSESRTIIEMMQEACQKRSGQTMEELAMSVQEMDWGGL